MEGTGAQADAVAEEQAGSVVAGGRRGGAAPYFSASHSDSSRLFVFVRLVRAVRLGSEAVTRRGQAEHVGVRTSRRPRACLQSIHHLDAAQPSVTSVHVSCSFILQPTAG